MTDDVNDAWRELISFSEAFVRSGSVAGGGASRYRLFRPPDHAGKEYDELYRSEVPDPGAVGTIKLGARTIMAGPERPRLDRIPFQGPEPPDAGAPVEEPPDPSAWTPWWSQPE